MQTEHNQPRIEQLVHGYRRGHRQLAGSETPAPEIAAVIDRLSDAAAGFEARETTYLTAYPLPDGRYAFARTWRARNAPRPNTVWTHTFILDGLALATSSLQHLQDLFREPSAPDRLESYMNDVTIPIDPRHASAPASPLKRALAGLYLSSQRPVRAPYTEVTDRERIATSIWDQLWPAARQRFAFCTALNAQRSLEKHPFDLLFGGNSENEHYQPVESPVLQALVSDILSPGPLRSYLHFVGSGVPEMSVMQLFVLAWLVTSNLAPSQDNLHSVATLLRDFAPQHRQLRRLKRSLFGLPERARLKASPGFVLALLSQELRTVVATEDASLEGWIRLAWKSDVRAVIALAKQELRNGRRVKDSPPGTVGSALPDTLEQTLPSLVSVSSIPHMARELPDQVVPILCAGGNQKLWGAWASLDSPLLQATLHGTDLARLQRSDLEKMVRALLMNAARQPESIDLIVSQRDRDGLDITIGCLLELPRAAQNEWRQVLHLDMHEVARALEDEAVPERVEALATLASLDELPSKVRTGAWSQLLNRGTNDRVLALAYLIGRGATRRGERKLGAVSYALLYNRLAEANAEEAWALLDSRVTRQKSDLDSCKRLARDWSKSIQDLPADDLAQLLRLVQGKSDSAVNAATDVLSRRKSQSILERALELLGWVGPRLTQ